MYEKIPQHLKDKAHFCLWKYEVRKGKKTKVPYQSNGLKADSTKVSHFDTFERATKVFKQGNYDGIGMMVADGFSAIDIDHCIVNGELTDMAKDIIDTVDSYTETSPSGNGIRIVIRTDTLEYDKDKYYINKRKLGLEMYISGKTSKFVTLTGNAIIECDVMERSEKVLDMLNKYMKKDTVKSKSMDNAKSYLSDDSVIQIASTAINGSKFKKLWIGDISDYSSNSEADMALCSILAFYCGGNAEQMDRLYRNSKLYREKWERNDYRENTIKTAISGCHSFYTPIRIDPTVADFNEIAIKLDELKILENNRYAKNDIGFGRLFADVFRDKAHYVEDRKKWFVFTGEHWESDNAGLRITELGKDLADGLFVYASKTEDENKRKTLLNWCGKWTTRKNRDIYIREAQSIYPMKMLHFDTNPFLFNCKNCTLDIRSGECHEHTPKDYITKISPVVYDQTAQSVRWNTFIDEIMSGDKEKAKYLQKSLGYSLTGDTTYECMFFFYGETTRNGKGTLVESILPVMGDYGITVRAETLAQKTKTDSHAPSEDIARLEGKRFANISEPGKGMLLNSSKIKNMTGNDTLNARFLNENSFDFKAQFKLYVNTNYLPIINDMTLFSSNRIIIIPFNRHFEAEEQDRSLKKKFKEPKTQSAILNWLIDGYRLL